MSRHPNSTPPPPADVIPAAQIAEAEDSRLAHNGVLPLGRRGGISTIEARACVPAYCSTGQNYECTIYVCLAGFLVLGLGGVKRTPRGLSKVAAA